MADPKTTVGGLYGHALDHFVPPETPAIVMHVTASGGIGTFKGPALAPTLDPAEIARLERDAAISLLIEAPVECWARAPMTPPTLGRCGTCWPCRVDKFLRDAGVRR